MVEGNDRVKLDNDTPLNMIYKDISLYRSFGFDRPLNDFEHGLMPDHPECPTRSHSVGCDSILFSGFVNHGYAFIHELSGSDSPHDVFGLLLFRPSTRLKLPIKRLCDTITGDCDPFMV